jgi:hypothetical protein
LVARQLYARNVPSRNCEYDAQFSTKATGYWYSRNNRLWPLVAAHAVFDLVSLLAYMKM